MYNPRRAGSGTDLHNAHTVSTLMRTMTTSTLAPNYSHRNLSRSKTSLNGASPHRSASIHQVGNREREVERLHRMLDTTRANDIASLEAKLKDNDKIISHQSAEIAILRETNYTLEQRLQELTDLKRDLSNKEFEERLKNDDLLRDLKDIDRLARKVQADKQLTVQAADRELTEAKLEIEQNHREMQALDAQVLHLTADNKSLLEELEASKNQFSACHSELIRLRELVDVLHADKSKLARRISKLVHNEKELLQELQKCRRTTKAPTPSVSSAALSKKLTMPVRLELHLKNVEDERDMYKHEVDLLQRLLNNNNCHRLSSSLSPTRSRGRSLSPSPMVRTTTRRDTTTSPVTQYIKRSASSCNTSPTRCTVCGNHRTRLSTGNREINSSEMQIRPLREELERLQRELRKYKRFSKEKVDDDAQMSKTLRERDELQLLLSKYERHMTEIQAKIKLLSAERDNLSILYEQTKEELQKARHELMQNNQIAKASLAAQSVLRKVEAERDAALLEARTAFNERDSLRERLRIATESGLSERARYEQRIEHLELDARKIDNDRQEVIQQNHVLRQQIKDLENKLNELSFTLTKLNQEFSEQKSASAQLRYLSDEAERLLKETQRQLNKKKEEIHALEDANMQLERRNHELQDAINAQKDDFHVVRTTVQTLDKEKERLCAEIDLKTEENIRLIQEINARTRRIEELSMILKQLEATLEAAKEEGNLKLKDYASLRLQYDRTIEELDDYRRRFDMEGKEMKRLQEINLKLSHENQLFRQELDRANGDREGLRGQMQDYIKQVSSCENAIAQKENDQTNLIEQYREATSALSRAQLAVNDMEIQINNLKQELQIKSTDIKRLVDRIDFLEHDAQQHGSVIQEYENQLTNMNRALQRNEDLVKKMQIDKQNLTNDYANLRDVHATIENKKEHIIRQLTSKDVENEQLHGALTDMKIEIDMLRTQLTNEKAVVHSLEELIASLREKEYQTHMQSQEKETDLHLAKDRANVFDLKLQSQAKEIASLRAQVNDLEADNKRLRTLLNSERQERERAAQDLRKLTDLTSHIDHESRYRSRSPRMTTSPTSNVHRSPVRSYSPARSDAPKTPPTKISISLKVSELDRSFEGPPEIDVRTSVNNNITNFNHENAIERSGVLYLDNKP